MDLNKIIGKKVVAIRGLKRRINSKRCEPEFILFDDGETFLEFTEQDGYTFHDCNPAAREIWTWSDRERWQQIKNNDEIYGDATEDF